MQSKPFSKSTFRYWNFSNFLRLLSLEAITVVVYYVFLPGDPKNNLAFGFSAVRLSLILFFVLIAILLLGYASKLAKW